MLIILYICTLVTTYAETKIMTFTRKKVRIVVAKSRNEYPTIATIALCVLYEVEYECMHLCLYNEKTQTLEPRRILAGARTCAASHMRNACAYANAMHGTHAHYEFTLDPGDLFLESIQKIAKDILKHREDSLLHNIWYSR